MAKDPAMSGPVTDPEGGTYETSEEIRAASNEGLTRSEVINEFGPDLGQKLIDGGYASLSSLLSATDEDLIAIAGIGPASVTKIREAIKGAVIIVDDLIEAEITVEESSDVVEEETVTEPEDAEVVEEVADADAVPEVVEVEESEDTGEEVLEETGSGETEEETEVADPPLVPAPLPVPVEEPQMSVRVRRAKESARKAEEQRQKEQAHWLPGGDGDDVVRPDLGSVGVDFVPEEDE